MRQKFAEWKQCIKIWNTIEFGGKQAEDTKRGLRSTKICYIFNKKYLTHDQEKHI